MPSAQLPANGTRSSAGAHVHYCPACRVNKTVAAESHDAILQYLDRRIGGLMFNKEPFIPTVDMWNAIPLVFGKVHVDPETFTGEGIEAELNRIAPLSTNGGAIVGELADAKIETSGHAKLMARKVYSIDTAQRMFNEGLISQGTLDRSKAALPEVLQLIEESKLSHSTGLICPDDGDHLLGLVLPNHVLDFEETPTDQPLDRGAVILNKQENENVTKPEGNPHTNIGKSISAKNKAKLQAVLDAISTFWQENFGDGEPTPKTNQEIIATTGTMNTPDGESLEGQIENVRRALSEHIGLKWADGTPRSVWAVMTMPDKVIWQHPDTSQYYATPYTVEGEGTVTFGQPEEVEQAYVVKEANTVFLNMTAEDLNNIAKRNKMVELPKTETDAAIAKLQKEKDDLTAAKDTEIAKLQKERDDLKAEQENVRLQKDEADWTDLKKTAIPPGLVKDPKDEADLRKLQKEDNPSFLKKILAARADPKFREEGSAHVSGPTAEAKEAQEADRILRASTGRAVPGTLH